MAAGPVGRVLGPPCEPGAAVEELTDGQLLERFTARHDGDAFAILVRRHGPMVLDVCRRVLRDTHLAEDAFQATFLVLVRKACSLRQPELLANWLYGVACRTAVKARANAARRCELERRAASMPLADPLLDVARREVRSVLDEEMSRLPEKYRAPLVLCYLEGKTNEDAARQLGWPTGSMSYRLARGREVLRQRLSRRGLSFATVPFTDLLSQHAIPPAVPPALADATVKAALLFAMGKLVAGETVSCTVTDLTEQMLRALGAPRLRWVAALLLALLLAGAGAGAIAAGSLSPTPADMPGPCTSQPEATTGAASGPGRCHDAAPVKP